jgi:hypothetical protein
MVFSSKWLAGRSVSPVCKLYIGDAFVNVQCKENAAAMHLCNKTVTNRAKSSAAGKTGEKQRYSRWMERHA